MAVFERSAWKFGPLLVSGNLDIERVSTTPRNNKDGSLSKLFV